LDSSFELKEFEQLKYLKCSIIDNSNLTINAFTTRLGGVSKYPFDSLNLSYNVNDKENFVIENRKIILDVLGINYQKVVSAQQIHKDKIAIVKKEDKGKGAFKYSNGIAESDALITNIPGIPLLMFYADCVPIIILDPIKKVIGLIHSGRRGTELEITLKTLIKMKKTFGTKPSCCLAAIFPSIGPCCYNFRNKDKINDYWLNKDKFSEELIYKQNKDEWSLDLKKANYLQLIKAGLQEENIFINKLCTSDNPEYFFSYRRDKGNTGRMAAIIMLK